MSLKRAMNYRVIVAPFGGRLYLPKSRTKDRATSQRAGVPEETSFVTNPAPVLVSGDSVYGDNAGFRAGLWRLGAEGFLQIDTTTLKGWSLEVPTELKQVRRHPTADAPRSQTLVQIEAGFPVAN